MTAVEPLPGVGVEVVRVLVCGSRDWIDHVPVCGALDMFARLHVEPGYRMGVVEGQCPTGGADRIAAWWATHRGLAVHHPVLADFGRLGPAAGPIRNSRMLEFGPRVVFAFHPDLGSSRGTFDMVSKAQATGVPVLLYDGARL